MVIKTIIEDSGKPYRGMTESELKKLFNIDSNSKNVFEMITSKILNIKGKVNKNELLVRENILVKTIRIESNGRIQESMSFPTFQFVDIVKEEWKHSSIRELFYKTKFLFVVFKKNNKDEYVFESFVLWKMPTHVIDSNVKDVWSYTKELITAGNIVGGVYRLKNGKMVIKTNFPGIKYNGICHVRPHARNSSDVFPLPVPDKLTGMTFFTKQCFWLNSTYIKKVIEDLSGEE